MLGRPSAISSSLGFPSGCSSITFDSSRFVWLWLLVVLIRVGTSFVLIIYSWYFHWLASNENYQRQWRREMHASSPRFIFFLFVFHVVALAVHLHRLFRITEASIMEHRLVFHSQSRSLCLVSSSFQARKSYRSLNRSIHGAWRRFSKQQVQNHPKLAHTYKRVVHWSRIIDIRGDWFDELFVLMESVEVAIQTIQVARTSALIPTDVVNAFEEITLLLNFTSTYIIERLGGASESVSVRTRLLLLLADACLDFAFCGAIPVGASVYFLLQLDLSTMTFSDAIHNAVWKASMQRQLQQYTMNSSVDAVSAIVFHLGLAYCLMRIEDMVERDEAVPRFEPSELSGFHPIQPPAGPMVHWRNDHVPMLATIRSSPMLPTSPDDDLTVECNSTSPLLRRCRRALHGISLCHCVLGIISVGVSLRARFGTRTGTPGCMAYSHDWLSSQASCMVMEINCYRRQIAGQAHEIEAILDSMNMHWAHTLILAHCPAIIIPPAVRKLDNLFSFEIYNSTLVDWPANASFSQQFNPNLIELRFLRTNFSSGMLPEGLHTRDFSWTIAELYFYKTNLVTLPDHLETSWNTLMLLVMEQGILQEVPPVIGRLTTLTSLSLVGNQITEIHDGVLDQLQLQYLYLSGNPLQRLPSLLADSVLAASCTLLLENTQLKMITPWLQEFLEKIVDMPPVVCQTSLYGSPLCGNRFSRSIGGTNNTSKSTQWLSSKCYHDWNSVAGWYHWSVLENYRKP